VTGVMLRRRRVSGPRGLGPCRGSRPAAAFLGLLALLVMAPLPGVAQSLYWEDPQVVVPSGVRFLSAATGGGLLAVMWQEVVTARDGGGQIYLSVRTSRDVRRWDENLRFAGPFAFEDRIVPLYSMAMDRLGRLYVALAVGERRTTLLRSEDGGRSFETLATLESVRTSLAPGLFVTEQGALLLFVTQESDDNLGIHYSLSRNGRDWDAFRPLVRDPSLPINFRPYYASRGGVDYVVFQGLATESGDQQIRSQGILPYQLYVVTSTDGGASWSAPLGLGFPESVEGQQWPATLFANQRPFLFAQPDSLALVWERQFQSNPTQIYYAELGAGGAMVGPAEAVTRTEASNYFPRLVALRDRLWLFWFDNTDRVFVAERRGLLWRAEELKGTSGASFFPYPVALGNQLYVFWENRVAGVSRLVVLQPDQSVLPPALQAVSFEPGQPSRLEEVQVRWSVPRDSSGIRGLGYVWSQDPDAPVPEELMAAADTTRSPPLRADRDGSWYFRAAVLDRAGNWSAPATIHYVRDTVPPAEPVLRPPPVDEEGFVVSNTFTMGWWPPEPAEEVAGYAYTLSYLGGDAPPDALPDPALPGRVETRATEVSYRNRDDGYWLFAVAAFDRAGNRSRPASMMLGLNKYVPVTFITYVNAQADPLGGVSLSIGGRGFSVGGSVSEVILDQDAEPPYEYVFRRSDRAFSVVSDRLIRDLAAVDIEEGRYRVGVRHPTRGLAWSPSTLSFESPGTVKYGDFSYRYAGRWQSVRRTLFSVGMGTVALWVVVAFLGVALVVAARKLASVAQDSRVLHREVLAVLRGEVPLVRKEQRMEELKRRGMGLRLKFTLLITVLVLITVLMVSIALGIYMMGRQRANLTEGLRQRAEVLLSSIATGAENNLPINNTIELGLLPDQAGSMAEATFVTITGNGKDGGEGFDYVWASNDPEIGAKVTGGEFSPSLAGEVRIRDDLSPILQELAASINRLAQERVSAVAEEANRLTVEAREAALREGIDSPRVRELQSELNQVNAEIAVALRDLKSRTGSAPEYQTQTDLLPFYTFYRPLVYRQRGENVYYRGAVRLGVSTALIQEELRTSTVQLLMWAGIIALVAAGLGLAGAILMAAITVGPILKITREVIKIRDTGDKQELENAAPIPVRTRDELGEMARAVTSMRESLVKAAIAAKDLTVGKEVQKMFIPLGTDESGRKGTSGGEENDKIEIYGYYEGAKGVSGDYFDYRKLDDQHYAVIKCDVAGKGVPAALIMVEVATIFSTHFRNWTAQSPGLKIDRLAYDINEQLEERGFKGRFAALTLAIINAQSGKAYFCNAGDTNLHVYRAAQRRMVEYKLPDAPAAGVFPNMLVEMQAGFKQVAQPLAPGDTVFMFTDGIEEAKHVFRNESFEVITCQEPGLEENQEHGGTHLKGSDNEELGLPRIYEIINSVLNRRRYVLTKYHNPLPGEELAFDFTRCKGSVEEAVLAMVSVEKVFRLVPDPSATVRDHVFVDRNIDRFLKEHFEQYSRYFTRPVDSGEIGDTIEFTHLKEDEQYDDLTILAIRRK